jgi:hypothetical protein
MSGFRRLWTGWVLTVMVCHLAASTAAVAFGRAVPPDSAGELVCTCTHGPGAECPMHKMLALRSKTRESPPGQPHCCSGRAQEGDMLMPSLIVWSAAAAQARAYVHDGGARERIPTQAPRTVTQARAPVSPPPRG